MRKENVSRMSLTLNICILQPLLPPPTTPHSPTSSTPFVLTCSVLLLSIPPPSPQLPFFTRQSIPHPSPSARKGDTSSGPSMHSLTFHFPLTAPHHPFPLPQLNSPIMSPPLSLSPQIHLTLFSSYSHPHLQPNPTQLNP